MKGSPRLVLLAIALAGTRAASAMATERPSFTPLKTYEDFEVREYPSLVVAETTVDADREHAGNEGFRRLAGYIFGGNKGSKKIAMTAPVNQAPAGEKIAMTAPVSQTAAAPDHWVIQFVMPRKFTLETLPEPNDARVVLKQLLPRKVAVWRYSGTWSEKHYLEEWAAMQAALGREGLHTEGEPTWSRYDPPWTPWFLRTNEIQVSIDDSR